MEKVNGIGGVFFRSDDPEKLLGWYRQHLGVDGMESLWIQSAGPTIFAPFEAATDYFGRTTQQWMINFRVDDLDAMIAQLERGGLEVITKPEWDSGAGRFARVHDPDGNPVELWEPTG